MSTAAEEVTFDKPTPVKKKPARKRARRAAAREKPAAPFPGLTRSQCATACNADGCAISAKNYCAHPTKGGLQASQMNDPVALKRLRDARDQIDVRLDPDRFK